MLFYTVKCKSYCEKLCVRGGAVSAAETAKKEGKPLHCAPIFVIIENIYHSKQTVDQGQPVALEEKDGTYP